ncbi:hypothetical protein I6N96_12640 [Enterococcus sp. BWM-S5]|uniref:Uncharacterized protein n=1 Tax=Enterococcus larvae TaxID=2794352 RepID=A0ABS4CKN1_9ENTE|nr:hypothetical protein [Enterococcus larvae]MBP1047121.1 hypothetical protein [Enterococcus larvae]
MDDLAICMRSMGFMVLEDNSEKIYLLEAPRYFLIVENSLESYNGKKLYSFSKYRYDPKKQATKLEDCFIDKCTENAMLKRVSGYIAFMLKQGYLKTENNTILPFAQEMSQRKIFV